MEHIIHFTRDVVLHGGKGPGVDTFVGLEEGTPVVVHYTVANADETAVEIDRVGDKGLRDNRRRGGGHRIGATGESRVKYANGKHEVMQLTPTAAAEASRGCR